jgi:hypothetical protein
MDNPKWAYVLGSEVLTHAELQQRIADKSI